MEILKLEKVPDFYSCVIDAAIMAEEFNWITKYASTKDIGFSAKLMLALSKIFQTLLSPHVNLVSLNSSTSLKNG